MDFPGPTQKQARLIWFAVTACAVALTLALIGVVLWGFGFVLSLLSPVLWPIAVAGVLAYLIARSWMSSLLAGFRGAGPSPASSRSDSR